MFRNVVKAVMGVLSSKGQAEIAQPASVNRLEQLIQDEVNSKGFPELWCGEKDDLQLEAKPATKPSKSRKRPGWFATQDEFDKIASRDGILPLQ